MQTTILSNRIEEKDSMYADHRADIQSFIDLIHGDIKKGVFFNVMQFESGTTKPIRTEFFDNTEKCMEIMDYMNTDIYDTYFSVQEFNTKKRRNRNQFAYTSFFFDIDCHGDNTKDTLDKTEKAIFNAVNKGEMLFPTSIISSGRGFHLYYVLDKRLPRKNLMWLYSLISEYMATQLTNAIKDVDGAELDINYRDSARILRVPFTANTKANDFSSIIHMDEERKFKIEDLRKLAGVKDKKSKSECKIEIARTVEKFINPFVKETKTTERKAKVLYFNVGIKLHNDRLTDLHKLMELRNNNCNGHRETILFLISYYSSFSHKNQIEENINFTNNKFTEKLGQAEVKGAINAGLNGFESWCNDNTTGYNYKNITLIKLLNITEEEQRQLKTIISKEEKYRRAKEKNWYNTKRDEERKEKRDEKKESVIELLKSGSTYKIIIEKLNVSRQYISKIKKEIGTN